LPFNVETLQAFGALFQIPQYYRKCLCNYVINFFLYYFIIYKIHSVLVYCKDIFKPIKVISNRFRVLTLHSLVRTVGCKKNGKRNFS
jgi:hypothetical protein